MKKPRSLVSDPAIVRPKSPPNKNVSNKASNKRETLRKRLSKTPWKIPRGFFAEFLGGRYVDVDSAEVLIHGMYATQRHPEIHTLSPSTMESGVFAAKERR